CLDYVDLFTTIDTSEESNSVQHGTQPVRYPTRPADYRICGDLSSVPQTEFYSIGSILFLIFHSVSLLKNERPVTFGGFVGQFAFIAKDNYGTDGVLKPDTLCTYQISHLSENQSHHRSGRIFSPYYPSNYPPRTNCHYQFAGANTERIILTFQSIQLNTNVLDKAVRHKPVCPENGDLIIVTERQNQTDIGTLARICGHAQGVQIVTHGPTVTVEFQSNGDLFKGQGFQASYEFVHRTQVQPSPYLSTASQFVEERQQRDHSYINPWAADDNSPHVGPIEGDVICRTINKPICQSDHAPRKLPGQAVWGMPIRCTNFTKNFGDRIEIYDGPSNRSTLLYEICGSETSLYDQFSQARAPELSEILSSGPDLLLTFQSDSVPGENEYGFKLLYEFRNTSAWNAKGSALVRETNWNPSVKSQHMKKNSPRNRCASTVGSLWILLLPLNQLVILHLIQRVFYVFIVEIQIQSTSVQNMICIV
ncbi:deleted in malignant brain tumors 1 protein, partial [Clonorchis sinensis]